MSFCYTEQAATVWVAACLQLVLVLKVTYICSKALECHTIISAVTRLTNTLRDTSS